MESSKIFKKKRRHSARLMTIIDDKICRADPYIKIDKKFDKNPYQFVINNI